MKKLSYLFFLILSIPQAFAAGEDTAHTFIPGKDDKTGLATKFQTGDVQLTDIPTYLAYLTDQAVWVAGVLAVIFFMIGGYQYLIGAYDDSTDEGKNTLKNVVIGLALVTMAWIIIDIAVRLLTE